MKSAITVIGKYKFSGFTALALLALTISSCTRTWTCSINAGVLQCTPKNDTTISINVNAWFNNTSPISPYINNGSLLQSTINYYDSNNYYVGPVPGASGTTTIQVNSREEKNVAEENGYSCALNSLI